MATIWHNSIETASGNWESTPDSWSGGARAAAEANDFTPGRHREGHLLMKKVAIGLALLLGLAGVAGLVFSLRAAPPEVAVLFPHANYGDWDSFRQGVELAADQLRSSTALPVTIAQPAADTLTLTVGDRSLVFRWYPESGAQGLRNRAHELAQRSRPPLAVVGANNSALTEVVATTLQAEVQAGHDQTPLLLMTTGTADHLRDLYPGRSFRVGFYNTYQVWSVIDRLAVWQNRERSPRPVRAIVLHVADDVFSKDLAQRFAEQLAESCAEIQPHGRQPGDKCKGEQPPRAAGDKAWALSTATDSPNPTREEKEMAARIIDTIRQQDHCDREDGKTAAQWVIACAFGAIEFRRMSQAIEEHFHTQDPGNIYTGEIRARMVMLSGDAISATTFAQAEQNKLAAARVPAPLIFFDHVLPLGPDERGVPSVRRDGTARLHGELVLAVASSFLDSPATPTPTQLAEALHRYRAPGHTETFFSREGERQRGGFAVLCEPVRDNHEFRLSVLGEPPVELNAYQPERVGEAGKPY